jgi:membrane protein implicated in regulation of membrane protease activity
MTAFLAIGVVGIVLLLFSLVVGEHLHGIFDALGGGDWFTGSSLAAFLGATGFGGAIVQQLTGSTVLAVTAGVVLGVVFGALVAYGMVRLRRSDTGGVVTTKELLNAPGVVLSDIPALGFGEIRVTRQGQMMKLNAKSAIPLATGTQVTVIDVLSATAVVVEPTYR